MKGQVCLSAYKNNCPIVLTGIRLPLDKVMPLLVDPERGLFQMLVNVIIFPVNNYAPPITFQKGGLYGLPDMLLYAVGMLGAMRLL